MGAHVDTAIQVSETPVAGREKRNLLLLNVVGGIAVLGSYVHGLTTHPLGGEGVWGGVPESIRPLYTVSMLSATVGYFLFSYFVFFRLDPATTRIGGRFGFGALSWLYGMILIPSALWMPLTYAMLDGPSAALWLSIRLTLAIVGIGSVGLIAALLSVEPRDRGVARWLAVAGAVAFSFQTAVLDALVWPYYFPL